MPSVFGKDSKKKELIKGLDQIYTQIQREHQISSGDFPDIKKMQVNATFRYYFITSYIFEIGKFLNPALFAGGASESRFYQIQSFETQTD